MKRRKGLRTALVVVGGWWGYAPVRRWIVADIAEGLAVARLRGGSYFLVHTPSGRRVASLGSLARCRELGRLLSVIPGWAHKLGWPVIDTISAADRALPDRVAGRGRRPALTSSRVFRHEMPSGCLALFQATLLRLDERPVIGLTCEAAAKRECLGYTAPEVIRPVARIEEWASGLVGRDLALAQGLGASEATPTGWREAWLLDSVSGPDCEVSP